MKLYLNLLANFLHLGTTGLRVQQIHLRGTLKSPKPLNYYRFHFWGNFIWPLKLWDTSLSYVKSWNTGGEKKFLFNHRTGAHAFSSNKWTSWTEETVLKVLKEIKGATSPVISQIRPNTHNPPCPNIKPSGMEKALYVTALTCFTASYSSFGAAH